MLAILRGVFNEDNSCERELMEGFRFDPVPERRSVSKAEILDWANELDIECTKTRVCLNLALIGLHQRKIA